VVGPVKPASEAALLAGYPPATVALILSLRARVRAIVPEATEVLRHGGWAYLRPGARGTVRGGICIIGMRPDQACVRLSFALGALMPDPHRLLTEDTSGKYMRRISLRSEAAMDALPLEDLLLTSYAFGQAWVEGR
jgi:hypothetical protein